MENVKAKDPASFIKEGYDATLNQARAVMLFVDDYHLISPEDKEAVAAVNKLPPFSELNDEAAQLWLKYPIGRGGDF